MVAIASGASANGSQVAFSREAGGFIGRGNISINRVAGRAPPTEIPFDPIQRFPESTDRRTDPVVNGGSISRAGAPLPRWPIDSVGEPRLRGALARWRPRPPPLRGPALAPPRKLSSLSAEQASRSRPDTHDFSLEPVFFLGFNKQVRWSGADSCSAALLAELLAIRFRYSIRGSAHHLFIDGISDFLCLSSI